MSYLLDLVKSLDEKELKKFRELAVTGKEETVRNEYVLFAADKESEESLLHIKLKLSKSHFDKINSVLLDKALLHIAGCEREDQFEFLLGKQLEDLILHELRLNERRLKRQKDKSALKEFYYDAFRLTTRFNYNNFPEKEMGYYCRSYLSLLNKKDETEKYWILAKQQELLVRAFAARKEGVAIKEKALKKFLQWQIEISNKDLLYAEVAIYLGLSAVYEDWLPEKGFCYLQQADLIARKIPDKIPERDKMFLIAIMAMQLVGFSRYEEGIAKYEELFLKFPNLAGSRLYHPYQYAFTLMIVNKLEAAKAVIEKYIAPFLRNENARNFRFDILRLYAIYYLLNHETEEAGNCLQQILQYGKEDFTPLGDVLFRLVHNVYCMQTGDYVLADNVFKKNLRFINSKLNIDGMDAYKNLFLTLGKIIRYKSKVNVSKKTFPIHEIDRGVGRARLYIQLITLPLQQA